MRRLVLLAILTAVACKTPPVGGVAPPVALVALTPTSPEVVGTPTWFDDVMSVADRDPRLRLDSISSLTRRKVADLSWMAGTWTQHYQLLATPRTPEVRRERASSITISRGGRWLVVRDSGANIDITRYLSYDAAVGQWKRLEVGNPTYASYAATATDWQEGQLSFDYSMALTAYLGHPLSQRETWRRISNDEWTLSVEERLSNGRYVLIEEERYTR